MMDYEALAQKIEGLRDHRVTASWNNAVALAADVVRREGRKAGDAKVREDSSVAASLGACVVELEQKIAQVEVRLGKRLADLERAQGGGAEARRKETGDAYWRGAAWMASAVNDRLSWGRNYEDDTIPVAEVRKVLKMVPKERR